MEEGLANKWFCYRCKMSFETPELFNDGPAERCPCGSSLIRQVVKKVIRNAKGVIQDDKECHRC